MLYRSPGPDVAGLLADLAEQLSLRIGYGETGLTLAHPDGRTAETWREQYPYPALMSRAEYAGAKRRLQIELLKVQDWVKATSQRVAIVFEGRDAAGKGGTIRRFTQHLNPRGVRVVALGKPGEHELRQWYFGRYLPHLPEPGEIVLFDRSWYNRAGVERVMQFCTPAQYLNFLAEAPAFEQGLAGDGITLIKLWVSVSQTEQLNRFVRRHSDPLRRWKLSPVDLASLDRWNDYTTAKESMFHRTGTAGAPWAVIKSNDKRRCRVEAIRYVLSCLPYAGRDDRAAGRPDPLIARRLDTSYRAMPAAIPAFSDSVSR
jgi:polyphosphate kinase 2